jgi:RNA recognition motif-containing protein
MPLGRYRKKRDTSPTPSDVTTLPPNEETTVMVRNIPTRITSLSLIETMVEHGFENTFDFIYSPIDFKTNKNVGYAFINFTSPEYKNRFVHEFQGFQLRATTSNKSLDIISSRRQGFIENISVFGASELLASTRQSLQFKPLVKFNNELVPLTEELFSFFLRGQSAPVILPCGD